MAVTSDMDLYNTMLDYTGVEIGSYSDSVPFSLGTGYEFWPRTGDWGDETLNYEWSYNIKTGRIYPEPIGRVCNSKEVQHILPAVFYSPAKSVDGIFKFLYSKPVAGAVGDNVVAEYLYSYTNDLGHGYIDCNGRQISKDLFTDSVDSGRTRGYNNKTVDLI